MLEARNVSKAFRANGKTMPAVRDVSLSFQADRVYALVGESGSGKSTSALMLMGLLPPSSGQVLLDGQDLASQSGKAARMRFSQMQMVLQDGKSALDPRFTVYDSIAEPLRNVQPLSREAERARVRSLLDQVELPREVLRRRAHELSGGQQKRVCIARALSVSPRFLLFDEAVSGLDVLVRKKILALLKALQRELGFTCLLITHDMEVALYMADEILVMKEGRIVEQAQYAGGAAHFDHPYAQLLLDTMLPIK